jgi:hypothetical protein
MNRILLNIGFLLIASLFFQACGNNEPAKTKETTNVKEQKEVPTAAKKEEVQEEEKLEPAKVKCEMMFESFEMTDEEGNVTSESSVYDVVDSKTKMSYTFCYDSESYKNFKLSGSGKELSLVVKNGGKTVFKKEGFELKDKMTFSKKDFSFEMAAKYTIELKQKETVLFSGKIGSEGCM